MDLYLKKIHSCNYLSIFMYCLLLRTTQLLTALAKLESQVMCVGILFYQVIFETSKQSYFRKEKTCVLVKDSQERISTERNKLMIIFLIKEKTLKK